jgi:uncharacterized membrane protein YeaQ/YmgE (transglycosylase-associated protein family)
MCSLLGWIIFGGIAGWLASIITGRNERQGCIMNIIVGVIGAFIGGFLYNLLTGNGLSLDFAMPSITNLGGFIVSVLGAVVLLVIVNLVTRRR